jgi:peptidoglycan/LPS O-acetylase OafA/YrhL
LDHFWPKSLFAPLFALGQLGWIAMDSFFVLSGFLITGILVDSRLSPTYFRTYYLRRTLRIFPLYYLVLIALCVMAFIHRAEYRLLTQLWGNPAWFFVYLGNFTTVLANQWPPVHGFGPPWSLQIEEQFYLLFPVLIRLLSLKSFSRVLWAMLIISPLMRLGFFLVLPGNPFAQFVLLPCHMEGLALGALIAIRFRSRPWVLPKRRLVLLTALLLSLTCIGSVLSTPSRGDEAWSSPFNRLFGYSISSWACAFLVLSLVQFRGSKYTAWLTIPPVQYLGKISYGIYLLHLPAWRCLNFLSTAFHWRLAPDGLPRFLIVVAMSILFATISWYGLELRCLRLKDRLSKRPVKKTSVAAGTREAAALRQSPEVIVSDVALSEASHRAVAQ